MIKLTEVKKLIKAGESETVEFKSSSAQLNKACETLCGFLNHWGGVVLIGVNDQGKLIGQQVGDKTRQEIAHELAKIEPAVRVELHDLAVQDKQVIVLRVKPGEHGPYVYDGRPYDRVASTTRRMPRARYEQLIAKRLQVHQSWESLETANADLSLIDEELILGIVRKAVEIKRLPESALRQDLPSLLERLKLLKDGCLNHAAMVLFGRELFPSYPQCQLKMARFKGQDRQAFLDSHLIYGNLFQLLEEALQFVRKHLPLAAKIMEGEVERLETPLIPFKAIREAMINALCHKDYSLYGGSIGLAIYDDRMELFNDGGLLPEVTIQKIKSGYSKLRNPLMAEILYKAGLVEKWGRGIQEIIRQCIHAGAPEPEFLVDEEDFKIIFPFPKSLSPLLPASGHAKGKVLSKRQEAILKILSKAEFLKATEIRSQLQEPPSERTLRDDLKVLKEAGQIGSQGHAKTALWFLIKS